MGIVVQNFGESNKKVYDQVDVASQSFGKCKHQAWGQTCFKLKPVDVIPKSIYWPVRHRFSEQVWEQVFRQIHWWD